MINNKMKQAFLQEKVNDFVTYTLPELNNN